MVNGANICADSGLDGSTRFLRTIRPLGCELEGGVAWLGLKQPSSANILHPVVLIH